MDHEIPIRGLEKLNPLERGTVEDVIRGSEGNLGGLTGWQRKNVLWQISRDRAQLEVKLVHLKHQTILAQAVIACEGHLAVTREDVALALFKSTAKRVLASGVIRDAVQRDAARLLPAEGSRDIVSHALDGLYGDYLMGVHRRANRR